MKKINLADYRQPNMIEYQFARWILVQCGMSLNRIDDDTLAVRFQDNLKQCGWFSPNDGQKIHASLKVDVGLFSHVLADDGIRPTQLAEELIHWVDFVKCLWLFYCPEKTEPQRPEGFRGPETTYMVLQYCQDLCNCFDLPSKFFEKELPS